MKHTFRIYLSAAILCLLLSVCSVAAFDFGQEILPNKPITVEISNAESELIKFSPVIDGVYRVESISKYDLFARVYDEKLNEIVFDDDSGETSNFSVIFEVEKNKDYYIRVGSFSNKQLFVEIKLSLVKAKENHEHKYEVISALAATCTKEGETVYGCICGSTYNEILPKTKHKYKTETVTKPTCTAKGQEKHICTICGETKTVTVPALGHRFSSGYTTDKAATCTAKGSKSKHCTRCDKKSEVTEISAKGHSYSSKWTIDKKSSFSSSGSKSHHCSRCGAKTDVTAIPKVMTAVLSKTQYVYNASDKKPSVTVKDSKGNKLKSGTDYDVSFPKDLKSIGSHSVFLSFKGNYSGKKTLTYKIIPSDVDSVTAKPGSNAVSLSWKAVNGAAKYRVYKYIEKTKEYVKLCDVTKTSKKLENLKSGTYYVFVVRAYKTVDGKDYFSQGYSKVKTATIPEKPKLSVKADGRQAVLSWKGVNSSGYEVYMSDRKDDSYSKIKTVKGETKYTKTNLAKGKTYYFKIRAYRKAGDKTVYSPYSNVVSVKIK